MDMQKEPLYSHDNEVAKIEGHTTSTFSQPQRIGGFLICIAIGLVLSLIQNLGHLAGSLGPLLSEKVWARLTNPSSPAYHSYWKPVLLFDVAVDGVVLALNTILLVLFFRKKRMSPGRLSFVFLLSSC